MKSIIIKYLIVPLTAFAFVLATTLVASPPVLAQETDTDEKCSVEAAAGENCAAARIKQLTNFMIALIGMAVVLNFMTGALMYITAGGSPEKVTKAKERMSRGFIGIVLLAMLGGVIRWILIDSSATMHHPLGSSVFISMNESEFHEEG